MSISTEWVQKYIPDSGKQLDPPADSLLANPLEEMAKVGLVPAVTTIEGVESFTQDQRNQRIDASITFVDDRKNANLVRRMGTIQEIWSIAKVGEQIDLSRLEAAQLDLLRDNLTVCLQYLRMLDVFPYVSTQVAPILESAWVGERNSADARAGSLQAEIAGHIQDRDLDILRQRRETIQAEISKQELQLKLLEDQRVLDLSTINQTETSFFAQAHKLTEIPQDHRMRIPEPPGKRRAFQRTSSAAEESAQRISFKTLLSYLPRDVIQYAQSLGVRERTLADEHIHHILAVNVPSEQQANSGVYATVSTITRIQDYCKEHGRAVPSLVVDALAYYQKASSADFEMYETSTFRSALVKLNLLVITLVLPQVAQSVEEYDGLLSELKVSSEGLLLARGFRKQLEATNEGYKEARERQKRRDLLGISIGQLEAEKDKTTDGMEQRRIQLELPDKELQLQTLKEKRIELEAIIARHKSGLISKEIATRLLLPDLEPDAEEFQEMALLYDKSDPTSKKRQWELYLQHGEAKHYAELIARLFESDDDFQV